MTQNLASAQSDVNLPKQQNSNQPVTLRWAKAHAIVDRTLPGTTSRLLRILAGAVDPKTQTTVIGVRDWARRAKVSVSTVQRHKKRIAAAGLVRWDARHDPRHGPRSRLTDRATFIPIEQVNFQQDRCDPPGVTSDTPVLRFRNKQQLPPKPPKGGTDTPVPEIRPAPSWPEPSREVYEAQQEARRRREARRAERWQRGQERQRRRAAEQSKEPAPLPPAMQKLVSDTTTVSELEPGVYRIQHNGDAGYLLSSEGEYLGQLGLDPPRRRRRRRHLTAAERWGGGIT
jgi:hypothetical protein